MRTIRNLEDVQIVLREILDWKEKLSSKDWDFRRLRIKNASPSEDPNDYVIRAELPELNQENPVVKQHYSIVWSKTGSVSTAEILPVFIFGDEREGTPVEVNIFSTTAPSTGNLDIQIEYKAPADAGFTSILSENLSLPQGQNGPVKSSKFILSNKLRSFGTRAVIRPTIINDGGAETVTITLVVKR